MKDAKFLLFTLLITFSSIVNAQSVSGKYQQVDQKLLAKNFGIEYNFLNGKVKKIKYLHLGNQIIHKGSYKIIGDTLLLSFKDTTSENLKFHTEIIKKEKLNSSETLEAEIFIENKGTNNLPPTNLILQSESKEAIMAFMSDNNGLFPKLNVYDKYIKYLHFSRISSTEMSIETDSLFGYRSLIKIQMNDSKNFFDKSNSDIKYIIQKNSTNMIILKPLNENDAIIKLKAKF